jgi:predicted negative regulator of RcsB-dependent stress response
MMKYAHLPERQQLLDQARQAVTLNEIDQAIRSLQCWKQAHPDDIGVEDAFEPLALMRLAAIESVIAKVSG